MLSLGAAMAKNGGLSVESRSARSKIVQSDIYIVCILCVLATIRFSRALICCFCVVFFYGPSKFFRSFRAVNLSS